jgi:hypothetical protein
MTLWDTENTIQQMMFLISFRIQTMLGSFRYFPLLFLLLFSSLSFLSFLLSFFSPQTSEKVHISFCFKYLGDPCDGSATSQNWTSLITDLFNEANSLITSHSLNLEFILDGAGTPGGFVPPRRCLDKLWSPWNSTWIDGSDPYTAFFSNNEEDGDSRFQIFNSPGPLFRFDVLAGKFVPLMGSGSL